MYLNHVQEGLLTDGWVGSKNFLHPTYNRLYISHNYETWHSYTLIKEDPKKKKKKKQNTWDTHWVLLTSTFFTRLTIFVISWNKDQNYFLIHSFWFFWFFLSMIVRLSFHFNDASKTGYPRSQKNFFVHEVTNKILSSDSYYTVNMKVW